MFPTWANHNLPKSGTLDFGVAGTHRTTVSALQGTLCWAEGSMGFNLQLLFTGIGVGSIYALVALGFVLIYRATNVVNFAQGDFAMLGAFAMVVLAIDLELPYWLSIVITLVLLAGFGALFNLAVYYPLRNRSFLPVIISTIGASILLENGVLAAYGPRPQSLASMIDLQGFSIGDVFFDSQYIIILGVTIVMVALQYLFFERTLLGKKMQATSQDKEMASLLGIPVALMIMITFMYSALLGGLAGVLVAPVLFVTVGMGSSIALKAFAASIIGGFGDVTGAIVGGLALGVIETFGAAYISVPYKDAFAFLMLFAILLVRPQGIFGERIAEKA
jgi:branched-chain amino acid transport system permease protein